MSAELGSETNVLRLLAAHTAVLATDSNTQPTLLGFNHLTASTASLTTARRVSSMPSLPCFTALRQIQSSEKWPLQKVGADIKLQN